MTNDEKQALIEGCTQRVDALNKYCRANPDDREAALDLSLCKLALAALTGQPVLYALRFKNHHGQPDKLINENCLFRSHEKASQYGKGGNYVTQASGKIEWVPNPQLDPEVVPLYSAPSFSD